MSTDSTVYNGRLMIEGGTPWFVPAVEGQLPVIPDDLQEYLGDVVISKQLGDPWRKWGNRLEESIAKRWKCQHAVAYDHCTSALEAALTSVGAQPGTEVIVPSFTFVAAATAVRATGATIVWVDSDLDTFNISPNSVYNAVTPNTVALVAIHMYGRPCNVMEIRNALQSSSTRIIEDCAQATGATLNGQLVGHLGDIGCLSFDAKKIISGGEGGAIVTDDTDVADFCRQFRSFGASTFSPRPDVFRGKVFASVGRNCCLSELQAAAIMAQFGRFDDIIDHRVNVGNVLTEQLRTEAPDWLIPPICEPAATSVYWRCAFRIRRDKLHGLSGCQFSAFLRSEGIPAYCYVGIPLHQQPALISSTAVGGIPFNQRMPIGGCANAELLARTEVTIEIGPSWTESLAAEIGSAICALGNRIYELGKADLISKIKQLPA